MSDKSKPEICDKNITGLKYFEKLLPLFERLHEVGCGRDTAGNRDLHFDEYCCLVMVMVMVLSASAPLCAAPKDLQSRAPTASNSPEGRTQPRRFALRSDQPTNSVSRAELYWT